MRIERSQLIRFRDLPLRGATWSLAEALRTLIEAADSPANGGLSQIAEATGIPLSHVADVLAGKRVPSRRHLDLLCQALQASPEVRELLENRRLVEAGEAHVQRTQEEYSKIPAKDLRAPQRGMAKQMRLKRIVPAFGQPDPIRVSNTQELVQALKAVHVWGGAPSLREMERRSGKVLKRSTISDMLRGDSLPDYDRYIAFLQACGVDEAGLVTWVFIWRQQKALETPEVAPWLPGATAS